MSATHPPKDLPPLPPRRKKGEPRRSRWVDPIRVHDDIRFGINSFRSVEPGDPSADNDTPEAPRATTDSRRRKQQ